MNYRSNNIIKVFLNVAIISQTLILSSCAEDSFDWLLGTPINLTATAEKPITRAGANIQTSSFEGGQTINAYFSTGGNAIGNTPTVLTSSTPDEVTGKNRLSPDVQPYYPNEGTVDIMAVYPKFNDKQVTNTTNNFTVEANQTADIDYKKSDLMWAGITSQVKTSSDINLQFEHLMAKISVTVTGKEGVCIQSIYLINTVRTVPVILTAAQYTLGSVPEESDDAQKTILLASTSSTEVNNQLSGSVLFPPQSISGNFIKVVTNNGDAYFSLLNKTFAQGAAYSADLVLKRQDIGFVTTITDWADNGGSIAVPPGSSAGLKISPIAAQEYDHNAKTPELHITYTPNSEEGSTIVAKTYTLIKDQDYTVEYFNNTNQGTAMVIVTGRKRDDWSSENHDSLALANLISQLKAMTSFVIQAAEGNIKYPANSLTVEYDFNTIVDHELDKHGGDGKFTYTSSDPEVADVTVSGIVTIRKVGSTRITASMDNSGNYSAASDYYDLEVTPRKIKAHTTGNAPAITATLASETFPYTGEAYSPAVVVKDNGRTLQENKHYSYHIEEGTNINKGTVFITIRGMGNYSEADADTIKRHFYITPITPDLVFRETAVKVPKGQKFTRRAQTNYGTVSYSVSDPSFATVSSEGVVTATNTDANHQPKTVTVTATVAADPNGSWVSTSKSYSLTVVESEWSYTYTGNVQSWTCPTDGVYELEAMGAQGATVSAYSGGKGADVAGQVFIKEGQILYIYLGEGGTNSKTSYTYNGGGYGSAAASGGGASDFALKNAAWDDDAHLYSRILVAAGGGGALDYTGDAHYLGAGGDGGGDGETGIRADYEGMTGVAGSLPGKGGTISAGGTVTSGGSGGGNGVFGKGGCYSGSTHVGCGGSGWFVLQALRGDAKVLVAAVLHLYIIWKILRLQEISKTARRMIN